MSVESDKLDLTYGFRCAKDLFEKLKRDGKLLEEQVTSDRFFNFVVTAYHLCEWVQKDPQIQDRPQFPGNNSNIAICRDITNASKHFGLNEKGRKKAVVKQVDSKKAFGTGRFGKGAYGGGEEGIKIILEGGKVMDAIGFKNSVVDLWTSFFDKYG